MGNHFLRKQVINLREVHIDHCFRKCYYILPLIVIVIQLNWYYISGYVPTNKVKIERIMPKFEYKPHSPKLKWPSVVEHM